MKSIDEIKNTLHTAQADDVFCSVYGCDPLGSELKAYKERFIRLTERYAADFGYMSDISLFSAPGRTEIGGNHTDHQHGNVLAASVDMDVIACAGKNDSKKIIIHSEGYPEDVIDLSNLDVRPEEKNKTAALIRGMAACIQKKGYEPTGFQACMTSSVLSGSGLSSSAAYETMIGVILNEFCCGGKLSAVEIAQMGQYAENVYFGKPCGLMDQMASSVGGVVGIDFKDNDAPVIQSITFDLKSHGYALCIIDTGADHSDLTDDYAAIPAEMKQIASALGKEVLRDTDEQEFFRRIPEFRAEFGDRPLLRALHFYEENRRAVLEREAIIAGNMDSFLKLVQESGKSSAMYLQNVYPGTDSSKQDMGVAIALAEYYLGGKGAVRVHGGGFAGTIQAFVPLNMTEQFKSAMEAVLGNGACHILNIRPTGGTVLL